MKEILEIIIRGIMWSFIIVVSISSIGYWVKDILRFLIEDEKE